MRGQNYGDPCKLNLQSCRFYIFLWKPKCLTVIHSKRTGLFLNVVVHSVDSMSGRSDLHFPIADGFAIASSWHVCYFYTRQWRRIPCDLLPEVFDPSLFLQSWHSLPWELPKSFPVFQISELCWNGASFKPERAWFLILEHRQKWKLLKYVNCISLMRNSSLIKRRKRNCLMLCSSVYGLSVFIHKLAGIIISCLEQIKSTNINAPLWELLHESGVL